MCVLCRRAGCLAAADSDDALPYCIAAGHVAQAVEHLTNRGHLSDAVLVAAAADEGGMPSSSEKPRQRRLRKFHTEDGDEHPRFCSAVYACVVKLTYIAVIKMKIIVIILLIVVVHY